MKAISDKMEKTTSTVTREGDVVSLPLDKETNLDYNLFDN